MRYVLPLAICLAVVWVDVGFAAGWSFDGARASWGARPELVREGERPRALRVIDGPSTVRTLAGAAPLEVRREAGDLWRFAVQGEAPEPRSMVWSAPVGTADLSPTPYFVLRYRALGLARSYAPRPLVALVGKNTAGKETGFVLLDAAEAYSDGLWHTVIGRRPLPATATELRVCVSTEDSAGSLTLGGLVFSAAAPAPPLEAGLTPKAPLSLASLQPLDLSALANDTVAAALERVLAREGLVTDGSAAPEGLAGLGSLPFHFAAGGNDLLRPEEHPEVNAEAAEFAGLKTTRKYYCPPGRDDAIAVPVGRPVSEVFLALCCELPKGGPRYAVAPGPKPYADIGALAVELRYADGESDLAFPYSLADGGYALQRMLGVYAVAADPTRKLNQVLVRNRVFGLTFSVAAATVNTSPRRLLPRLARPPAAPVATIPPTPRPRSPYLRREGQTLALGNRYYEVAVDCREGFALTRLTNHYADLAMPLAPGSGLEVRSGDTVLTGRAFSVETLAVDGLTARIALRSTVPGVPLRLELALTADTSAELKLQARVSNTGREGFGARIRFPMLRGVQLGAEEDTWLCFPRYSSVVTNRRGLFISPNDRSFCLQFVDASNPRRGGGVSLLTRNLSCAPLVYALGKTASGVTTYLEYPEEYYRLPAGRGLSLTESRLLFHGRGLASGLRGLQRLEANLVPGRSTRRTRAGSVGSSSCASTSPARPTPGRSPSTTRRPSSTGPMPSCRATPPTWAVRSRRSSISAAGATSTG